MEFRFDAGIVLRKPITIFSSLDMPRHALTYEKAVEVIDELGIASAKAQNLRGPVTTTIKLRYNPDHHVYILREVIPNPPVDPKTQLFEANQFKFEPIRLPGDVPSGGLAGGHPKEKVVAVAMIKVGRKSLFLNDEYGRHLNVNPLCVLDFYVHESFQRKGYGKKLFEYMLMLEMQSPGHLAYDRPSEKFLSFLRRHYGLSEYVPQVNNFVVFKQYGLECLDLSTFSYISPSMKEEKELICCTDVRGRTAYRNAAEKQRMQICKTVTKNGEVIEHETRPQQVTRQSPAQQLRQSTSIRRITGLGPKSVRSFQYPEEQNQARSIPVENVGANPIGNARIYSSILGAREMTEFIETSILNPLTGDQVEDKNLDDIEEESEQVHTLDKSDKQKQLGREPEMKLTQNESLSNYWQSQAQSRKSKFMAMSQSPGRTLRSSALSSPPTNIYSPRQQELLSSMEDIKRGYPYESKHGGLTRG